MIMWLSCAFILAHSASAQESVDVTIQGIDDRLYDNVTAVLKIFQKRKQTDLTEQMIRRMHRGAEEEIQKALEPFGYYSPVIVSDLEKSEEGWTVTYQVDAGDPVRVVALEIQLEATGETPHAVEMIPKAFPLKKGDILDHTLYEKGKKHLLQKIFAYGYLKAAYSKSIIRVNRKDKVAEIDILLLSGPRFFFGKTSFQQDLLHDKLLTRYVNYREGEPYSQKKLNELQRDLYKTNYFGRVKIKGEVDKAENLHVPINISLDDPQFFNRYTLGVGYASDDGIRGRIGWNNRLLNRGGHTLSTEIKLSERENSLGAVYGVPIWDPRFDKILYIVSYDDEEWDETDTRLFKGGINYVHAEKKLTYGAGFEVRDERYQVGVTEGESFLPVPQLTLSKIFAKDPVNTKNGFVISADVRGASEGFFGDTTFLQGQLAGKAILSPFENFRLIGRLAFGATSVDSIDDLPPSLRFYAGGDQSVRGYGYKEIGPEDSSGTVIGGKYLFFGSIEAEKVFPGNWSLAAFLDSGNAVNGRPDEFKQGVGIGIRYRLPFGQLKLDLASAVSEEDNPLRLHFTVGGDL